MAKLEEALAAFQTPEGVEEIREDRKRQVALGYRILAAQRWGDLGDGHISARDPKRTDCFWMLRYGVSYHEAMTSDLVLVGPNGELVEGEGIINVAGYYIHHPILAARPDLVSVTHVHTGWGTPFSAEVRPIEPITQESCVFFEDHAIFDNEDVRVQSTVAGELIAEALGTFVMMERVAEAHMKARDAKPISAEAARYAKKDLIRFGAGRPGFWSLVSRHIGEPSAVIG